MNDLFNVTDKTIAITGGGGVLCGTLATALGQAGATLAVLDVLEEAGARVADKIQAAGGKAVAVQCDVLDKASLESAKEKARIWAGWPWVIAHPTTHGSCPQIRTCATNAYGSSSHGFAARRYTDW